MLIAVIVLGIMIASGAGWSQARYVTARSQGRRIPAFGHPNIYNWRMVGKDVPNSIVLKHVGALVVSFFLIAFASNSLNIGLAGLLVFFLAAFLPIEVLRRRHNRSVTEQNVSASAWRRGNDV